MKIGVLGTGMVGRTIGSRLVELGYDVRMGSRTAGNERAAAWAAEASGRASEGAFRDAAAFGEVVFNCTAGEHSLAALEAAGAEYLRDKVLIDVANPLDYSQGMPPCVRLAHTGSLGERIQAAFPDARVVKTLNTVNASVMVRPDQIPGDHVIFVCGDDAAAKSQTVDLLGEFGWPSERVLDLGGIAASRGPEMYVQLWIALLQTLGTPHFNITLTQH